MSETRASSAGSAGAHLEYQGPHCPLVSARVNVAEERGTLGRQGVASSGLGRHGDWLKRAARLIPFFKGKYFQ